VTSAYLRAGVVLLAIFIIRTGNRPVVDFVLWIGPMRVIAMRVRSMRVIGDFFAWIIRFVANQYKFGLMIGQIFGHAKRIANAQPYGE